MVKQRLVLLKNISSFWKYLHFLVNPPFHGSIMLRAWTNSSYLPFFVGKCFFRGWSCPDMLNLIINSATRCSYKKMSHYLLKLDGNWTFSDHSCKITYFQENILQGVKILKNRNIRWFLRITIKYLFLIPFGQTKAYFIKKHTLFLKIFAFISKTPLFIGPYVESLNKYISFTFFW